MSSRLPTPFFAQPPAQYERGYLSQLVRSFAVFAEQFRVGIIQANVLNGVGSPEGVVTAPVGTLYTRSDGGTGTTLYVKESGTGNTGWVAK